MRKNNGHSLYINRKEGKLKTGNVKHLPRDNCVKTGPGSVCHLPSPGELGTEEEHMSPFPQVKTGGSVAEGGVT